MIASNKDRGVNKKIVNIFKEYLSNPSQEIYSDIKNGIDKLEESELVKLLVGIVSKDVVNLYSDKINKVGDSFFARYFSLTTVDLPNATTIGGNAFQNCTNLTTVDLPSVESIGASTFYDCTNLTTVNLPSAESISGSTFHNCTNLTSIDLPNATSIAYNAFYGCKSLTSIDLPSAESIGDRAFRDCINLTTVDLPNVTTIGEYAFYGCKSLTSIILSNDNKVSLNNYVFDDTLIASGTGYIYVPDDLVDEYKVASNWSTYSNQIKPLSELPTEE